MFNKDLIFTSNAKTAKDVFIEVNNKLNTLNLVTTDFLPQLIQREKEFPTGMDMQPVNPALPNIAIPHTEIEFVHTTNIVPIKLNYPVSFHNMINPDETLEVGYLFMILNNQPNNQTGMLASIMDFMVKTDEELLKQFFHLTEPDEIYDFLIQHF